MSALHNKYSYCLNNPLKYTDPSGWAWSPISALNHDQMMVSRNNMHLAIMQLEAVMNRPDVCKFIGQTGRNSLDIEATEGSNFTVAEIVSYLKHMKHILQAVGVIPDNSDETDNSTMGRLEVMAFIEEYFGNIPGLRNVFVDGTAPEGFEYRNGVFVSKEDGHMIYGKTVNIGQGLSDVYIVSCATQDLRVLYVILGHELNHVLHFYAYLDEIYPDEFSIYTELIAWDWTNKAISKMDLEASLKADLLNLFSTDSYIHNVLGVPYQNGIIIDKNILNQFNIWGLH